MRDARAPRGHPPCPRARRSLSSQGRFTLSKTRNTERLTHARKSHITDAHGGQRLRCRARRRRAVTYPSARDLFEAAREAAQDVRRVNALLDRMEEEAVSLPSPSFEPRGRRGSTSDRVGRAVARTLDRTEALERRLDEDYRLIDAATAVLYGTDGVSDGLATIAPAWWADAIYHRYLSLMTWVQAAALVMYSPRYVQACVRTAFELMDSYGMAVTLAGQGVATN